MMLPAARPAFCLLGPTAIGKSDLAIQLAEKQPVEIISVDSALVYRHMDIGTAKPSETIRQGIPHHLINIINPDQQYSAGAFKRDASAIMETIWAAEKTPLLVGGTMLYFKSLQQGLLDVPSIPLIIREALNAQWLSEGGSTLYRELQRIDPALAMKLHANDKQRILRGLEVYRATGQVLSLFQKALRKQEFIRYINLIILPEQRLTLHERIDKRFKAMLNAGFIEEVQMLRANFALSASMNAMRAVGYRQVWQYLDGELNFDELIATGSAATRQLAKRQLTWLRTWPQALFFVDSDPDLLKKLADIIGQTLEHKVLDQ